MKANPVLEEIWAIKDELAAQAGGDFRVFCQQLREWSAKNIPPNTVVHDPAELRALLLNEELAVREQPPKYGNH